MAQKLSRPPLPTADVLKALELVMLLTRDVGCYLWMWQIKHCFAKCSMARILPKTARCFARKPPLMNVSTVPAVTAGTTGFGMHQV